MAGRIRGTTRASAAAISLATAVVVLAATQPADFGTPNFDLAALIIRGTASDLTSDAMAGLIGGELGQEPDGGPMYTNYPGGPIDLDGATRADDADVISVGDGPDAAAQLTELLNSTAEPNQVFHVNYEFDAHAQTQVLNVFTDAEALTRHDSKKSVDTSGNVDCTGAVTCQTDPRTQVTTVTYPDGVVAVIERIKDITLVAYQTLGASVLGHLIEPARPTSPEPTTAPQANGPVVTAADPVQPADAPPPAPAVPAPAADRGPRLNVLRPAPNFSPGRSPSSSASSTPVKPGLPAAVENLTGTVNDMLTRVSDTVKRVFNQDASAPATGRPGSASPAGE
ncbi:hypothetical protein BayCH28_25630 [Mycolicibacterium sp. CH28]|uniref:hypothetical protein n=1 Tax=Mycolicibacterium sp. CH28 TaxID=2512237 RepID=UPI0010823014|nr:hypothetical protein [Mycolicibacterium sp. CH28]TGD84411.1 hypothetical protein BayCH28_25630 [Mycolicibacterium sp. CH28]